MSQAGQASRLSGWDRCFIEAQFGAALADRMREALRPVWRQDLPTLWSEREPGKRNNYLTKWQLGLAAIAAEAEDRAWATKLTTDEAKLACRYAPIQLNGLPSWLDDLAMTHPAAVQDVLNSELAIQLRAPASVEGSGLLNTISYSSERLKSLFRPSLLVWLDESGDMAGENENEAAALSRLETILDILLQEADAKISKRVCEGARARLAGGITGPANKIWLSALLRLDPESGMAVLERALGSLATAKYGPAIDLIAALFGDRHSSRSILPSGPGFSPQLLLRLVTLAYRHVRIGDDDLHEGGYTPDVRDHAQYARNALLDALLQSKGPYGWAAKLALAKEPWFAHMRDRVLMIARETAADEADGQPATVTAVTSLERNGETPPATLDDMFQLMEDRFNDFDDLLLQDDSPRELWAGVKDERLIRREISRTLKIAANGCYTLTQEGVTADEKETDIRLRSTVSSQEGVIEVKVGEKDRSAADLRQALSDQLVRKYMAPDMRRAGFLLITVATDRQWKHPETGEQIDITGLIALLNCEARRIMDDLGGTLRVAARALDLRRKITSERITQAAKKREKTAK